MSIPRFRNTIGGARIGPDSSSAGGIWNLGEVAMYRSFYSSTVPSWPSSTVTRGLIGFWDAGVPESYAGTGTTWSDIGGNGYTGTLTNGPTYTSDNGGGIVFDGSNDYVTTTYSGNTGNNFTLGIWCKPTAVGQSNGSDLAVKNYAATQPFASYGISYLSTSVFSYLVANNLTLVSANGATTSSINNIYYTVLTFGGDTSDKTIRGYVNINGVMTLDVSSTIANNPAYNTQAFAMGTFTPSPTNNNYTGHIYAVHLYNVALTLAEIQQNFDAMRGRFGL